MKDLHNNETGFGEDQLQDINSILSENRHLKARIKELEASNDSLTSFAHVISHDLKAPLRTINSFSRLIERRYSEHLDESGKEFINLICSSASTMTHLIDEILQTSKQSNRMDVSLLKSIDLNDVMKETVNLLSERIAQKNARVDYTDMPTILGYHSEFIQIFQNLICNSLKFSDPARAPRVHVSCTEVDTNIYEIEVIDNGIGIAKEKQARVFEKFFSENDQKYEGTGLGLFTCNKIVQNYGGSFQLNSQLGSGTALKFSLQGKRIHP